jgi:hypothetical protein
VGTERLRVVFLLDPPGGKKIAPEVNGAKWFYGNSKVSKQIGAVKLTEKRVNDYVRLRKTDGKELLVLLIAVLKGQGVAGVGNAAQNDKSYRFEFYCDPSKAEDAMMSLPGLTVDRGAGLGSMKIDRVYRKLQVSRR